MIDKHFVITKTELDFEGYDLKTEVLIVKDTIEEAEKYILTLPKPTLCHCEEHDDFEYRIKVFPIDIN